MQLEVDGWRVYTVMADWLLYNAVRASMSEWVR